MEISKVFLQIGEMMIEGKNDPKVDEFAKEVKNVSGNLSDNLLWKVANSVKYIEDVKEYWQSPAETLKRGWGDCEDYTILLGAAALRLGILTRYKVVSFTGEKWDHIYPLLYEASNKRWHAADATLDNIRLGRECQHLTEATFGVNGGVYQLGSYIQYSSFEWLFALGITILAMIAILIHK
ncbi:hypothetical protein KAV79_07470 [Candidatus Aerophobetes bacterium]|nr:hypothetical protein [Candidatus Aerophobetes bacterium]